MAIHVFQVCEMKGEAGFPVPGRDLKRISSLTPVISASPSRSAASAGLIAVSVTRNADPDATGYSLLGGGLP
jgi:hypothetical protein